APPTSRHCSTCHLLLRDGLVQKGLPQVPRSQTASLGSRVILPCAFRVKDSPVNPSLLVVIWKFGNKEMVKYENNEMTSNMKASMDTQVTMNGDVSLSLYNVTISDEGTYKCLVIYGQENQDKTINLHVQGMVPPGVTSAQIAIHTDSHPTSSILSASRSPRPAPLCQGQHFGPQLGTPHITVSFIVVELCDTLIHTAHYC
uniref:Ig-like domain-containing protein n=1 Tax=Leptobrachium leishanense TaxID=445787 RepID=A0A8C5PJ76_9ANUR